MRMTHFSAGALAALVTFAVGASAITAQPRRAPATAPLFPLSERDLGATRQSGCECTFRAGRHTTLFQMIGDEVTIRTRAGRQVCAISAEQFSALSNDRGVAACGGLRMSFRRTGRVSSHPQSDSADWPASLTVQQGRTRRTLAGRFGCAC
ncbi:MAG TPA: hypothetical protein VEC11_12495 [Allosphingosinicella sp.]|nr:hypothetical protein [Allosphingosinicella sp.]